MVEILRQLYDGELYPAEQLYISDKEFKRIAAVFQEAERKFGESLNDALKMEFERLNELRTAYDNEYNILNFKKGFQLGMQLTLAGLEIPYCSNKLVICKKQK